MFKWIVLCSYTFAVKKYIYNKKYPTFANLLMKKPSIDLVNLVFYKQPVYKQLALAWQIAKQLSGLNHLSLSNNKHYRLKITIQNNNLSKCTIWGTGENFFISWKSYLLFSRYVSFCIFKHPRIYKICNVMMSISTWNKVHFSFYFLNHNSKSHQTWSIDRYKQGQ